MTVKVLGFITFYIIWFLATGLAAHDSVWLLALFFLVSIQLFCMAKSRRFQQKIYLVILVPLFGWFFDSLMMYYQVILFHGEKTWFFAPYWLLFLWIAFASVVNQFLYDKLTKVWLWSGLAFLFFPLNYYAGCRFGAGIWLQPWFATGCYALLGSSVFFLLYFCQRYLEAK